MLKCLHKKINSNAQQNIENRKTIKEHPVTHRLCHFRKKKSSLHTIPVRFHQTTKQSQNTTSRFFKYVHLTNLSTYHHQLKKRQCFLPGCSLHVCTHCPKFAPLFLFLPKAPHTPLRTHTITSKVPFYDWNTWNYSLLRIISKIIIKKFEWTPKHVENTIF